MITYFSKRYKYEKNELLKPDYMPDDLKNRIFNVSYKFIKNCHSLGQIIEEIWVNFFKNDITKLDEYVINYSKKFSLIPLDPENQLRAIRDEFFKLEWYRIYDFIEFLIDKVFNDSSIKEDYINEINKIFEEEKAPYQIIDGLVTPKISEEEKEEIEKVLNINNQNYAPVQTHLKKALELYHKRPKGDYKNSIKESISAIEALARIILDNQSATLGDLVDKLTIHPALKEALKKLYGWASDESGIRHSEKTLTSPLPIEEVEARFMLVICSAFINYIIFKLGDYKNNNLIK